MPPAILPVAAGFWSDHRDEVTAVATLLGAIALALLVDRALSRRGTKLAIVVSGGQISAVTDTRLRMLRRLVFVAIVVIGVALALMQFTVVKRTAAGVLASSAVIGLVVGFAARQTLANLVAGILLAITQPIRTARGGRGDNRPASRRRSLAGAGSAQRGRRGRGRVHRQGWLSARRAGTCRAPARPPRSCSEDSGCVC
jgi:hypothetical protein